MFHRCLFLYAVGMLEWNSLTAVSSLFFPLLKSRIVSELTFFLSNHWESKMLRLIGKNGECCKKFQGIENFLAV